MKTTTICLIPERTSGVATPLQVASRNADGLSFFSTTVNLNETKLPASMNPTSLLARLGSICNECLPEDSGLND